MTGEKSSGTGQSAASFAPKPRRKQRISCGACYLRRVKCDLRDRIPNTPAGVEPKCTNCEERNIRCVNEFEKASRKPRNAQRGVGGTTEANNNPPPPAQVPVPTPSLFLQPPSLIPTLQLGFFASPFFRRFHTHRPILDPAEFSGRYLDSIQGRPESLGPNGILISRILVAWAASYGVDEFGREKLSVGLDAEAGLVEVKRRRDLGNMMAHELLEAVDRQGILRTSSWDGVRSLLLLMPLTEDILSSTERMSLYQSALHQMYVLTSTGAPALPRQDAAANRVSMARTFWYTHIHEGITNGIRGRKLVFEQDDITLFRDLPSVRSNFLNPLRARSSSSLVHTPLTNTYTYRFALTPIRVSSVCRTINAALTGPKALHRPLDSAKEAKIKGAWEMLTRCWDEFEDLRAVPPGGILTAEDTDRYCGGWQIFIFECHNIVFESLKVRFAEETKAYRNTTYIAELDDEGNPRTPKSNPKITARLLALSESLVRSLYPYVIRIIGRAISSPSFFQYDAALTRDGVLFAGNWATNDVDRNICLQALASMRWAYSFSDIRVELLRLAWQARARTASQYVGAISPHPQASTSVTYATIPLSTTENSYAPPAELPHPSYPPDTVKIEVDPYTQAGQFGSTSANVAAEYATYPDSYIPPSNQPVNEPWEDEVPDEEVPIDYGLTIDFDPNTLTQLQSQEQPEEPEWDVIPDPMTAETIVGIVRPYTPAMQPSPSP